MNQHDSERLSEVLEGAGYRSAADVRDASLIVLNTCSVREKAEQKLRSEVGRLAMLKRERPELVLVVAGCVAQQEGEHLLRRMPSVDVVIGPDNIVELPALLAEVETGAPPRARTVFDTDAPQFLRANPQPGKSATTAFVTTMKGCNERCSFCIVPTTRGPERYRPSSDVVDEVKRLVAAGVREITLLGQTVNSYVDPERRLPKADASPNDVLRFARPRPGDETEFPALLRAIAEAAPELRRLRYTSPHPRHLTPALARAHADLPVLARHVHRPFQSGSDRVLKRMIRRYSVAEYVERVTMLRNAVPGLTLSTDVIVGFPGETREDFERTLELVSRVGFVGVFGFNYSVRPNTPAKNLEDDVPEDEKSARLAELFALVDVERRKNLESLVGTSQRVLIEGPGKGGLMTGRTERNEIVHVAAPAESRGEILSVQIRRAYKNSLAGEIPGFAASILPRTASERRALPVV
jgi:tRNA-2-methylthio-N6-dimethylallyladenosine synthase